jgi:hypothetical protein
VLPIWLRRFRRESELELWGVNAKWMFKEIMEWSRRTYIKRFDECHFFGSELQKRLWSEANPPTREETEFERDLLESVTRCRIV